MIILVISLPGVLQNQYFKDMDLNDIFGPNPLCRERQFTSDPGNLDLPAPHVFLDDTSIGDAHFVLPCSPDHPVFNDSEVSAF